jgi:dihydroorotate dehydrogenase (fumarate)
MTASALLRHGPEHASFLLDGLSAWMTRKGFTSVDEVRGLLAATAGSDHSAEHRNEYVTAMRAANAGAYVRN